MKQRLVKLALMGVCLLLASQSGWAQDHFAARIRGSNESPAVATDGNGGGVFTLNAGQTELSFVIGVTGLSGDIVAAHFHNGAAGANGPVVKTLTTEIVNGVAVGKWTSTDAEPLTSDLVTALRAGNIYVNMHTALHPGGEVRGQLVLDGTVDFAATLSGAQENPPLEEAGSGGGVFSLNAEGTELHFTIGYSGLSGSLTAAHFHNAAAGTNGGVVRTLTTDFENSVATGEWKDTDSEPLTAALVGELLAGRIYVNAHTAAHPSGEVRGQVNVGGTVDFAATLSGAQENPPLDEAGSGGGVFSLNAAGTELRFTIGYSGLSGSLTAAHFHNAATGANGGVVRTLTTDFENSVATGEWKDTDSEPLTAALVGELLAGRIYVNAHTAAHPSGEVRGQVLPVFGGTLPVKLARNLPDGTANTAIEGVITTVDFDSSSASSSEYYLQDNTAGIRLFVFNGKAALNPGTLVRVTGTVGTNSGRKSIEADSTDVVVFPAPGLPAPQVVTIAFYLANQADFAGQYIRINNATITGDFPAAGSNATLSINDGTGDLAMFIDLDTDIDGTATPSGTVNISGVATSSNGTPQIQPSSVNDFETATAVEGPQDGAPVAFNLAQNYPNPFNPTTTIRYDVPRDIHITMVIYNMLGMRVRTLVDKMETTGYKQVTWNGTDDAGRAVASGIYFYRIETAEFTMARKLTMIK